MACSAAAGQQLPDPSCVNLYWIGLSDDLSTTDQLDSKGTAGKRAKAAAAATQRTIITGVAV